MRFCYITRPRLLIEKIKDPDVFKVTTLFIQTGLMDTFFALSLIVEWFSKPVNLVKLNKAKKSRPITGGCTKAT